MLDEISAGLEDSPEKSFKSLCREDRVESSLFQVSSLLYIKKMNFMA
jgi:hypothetical protein